MKIVVLDAQTLGADLSLKPLEELGECTIYKSSAPDEVANRIADCEVVVLNKIKLNATNLYAAKNLKLICVAATGYDNIDVAYCKENGIAVCNVVGYSSHSVAQVTVATVLSLFTHIREYNGFVTSGEYTQSGVANKLSPVYHEIFGKTWGIIGFGNIGREVGNVAKALGCNLIVCKRTPEDGYRCVDIDTLCKESDIITVHTPLNESTKHLINKERLSVMKKDVVIVNEARGAVTDEAAVAEAVKTGEIGAFGSDVYSVEPFDAVHPFNEIKDLPNVCLTPHMAWGAYEARVRCLNEIVLNIKDFYSGGIKGRVDLQ
ncbi:MAG: hydroxyacid dehydrogenase [Clostridia bacterium]|nr:hydroxyacid dehydrogenase [Clostridia bacterium]